MSRSTSFQTRSVPGTRAVFSSLRISAGVPAWPGMLRLRHRLERACYLCGMKPKICPHDRSEWRDWLARHGVDRAEVWVVFFKKHTGKAGLSYREALEEALRANPTAWQNFLALAPGCRKQYTGWLNAAVKPATRKKRLEEAVRLLEQNRKLGMK